MTTLNRFHLWLLVTLCAAPVGCVSPGPLTAKFVPAVGPATSERAYVRSYSAVRVREKNGEGPALGDDTVPAKSNQQQTVLGVLSVSASACVPGTTTRQSVFETLQRAAMEVGANAVVYATFYIPDVARKIDCMRATSHKSLGYGWAVILKDQNNQALAFSCPAGATLRGGPPPQALKQSCETPDGKLHGLHITWRNEFERATEGEYVEGQKVGRWLSWFNETTDREEIFRNGTRISTTLRPRLVGAQPTGQHVAPAPAPTAGAATLVPAETAPAPTAGAATLVPAETAASPPVSSSATAASVAPPPVGTAGHSVFTGATTDPTITTNDGHMRYGAVDTTEIGGVAGFSYERLAFEGEKAGRSRIVLAPSISRFVAENVALSGVLLLETATLSPDVGDSTSSSRFAVLGGFAYYFPGDAVRFGPQILAGYASITNDTGSNTFAETGFVLQLRGNFKFPIAGIAAAQLGLVFEHSPRSLDLNGSELGNGSVNTFGVDFGFFVYF